MITIMSYYFWSDWTETKKYEVDETQIHGIELHLRFGLGWHAVIVPKKGDPYEASHMLVKGEANKLLSDPRVIILKIVNYAQSEEFIPELKKTLTQKPSFSVFVELAEKWRKERGHLSMYDERRSILEWCAEELLALVKEQEE